MEAEQRLDEAVFHRLAVVDARVRLAQAADKEALVRPEQSLIHLDLWEGTRCLLVQSVQIPVQIPLQTPNMLSCAFFAKLFTSPDFQNV